MRALKKEIFFVLLFMMIGIAAVTTNVVVNMSTKINQNPDDFLVYFSDVAVDGEQDLSLVENEHKLVFSGEFTAVGDKKVISYDITNASKNYDADVLISCTESTTYLTITNVFDMKSSLSARSTRTGTLTVELATAVSEEISQEVTCTIEANAVERETQGSGSVGQPLERIIPVGTELMYRGELFNVIENKNGKVSLLARYNVWPTDGKQNTSQVSTLFAYDNGWEYTPGPKEIDLDEWSFDVVDAINSYVLNLQSYTSDSSITGDLLTLSQLKDLGCTIEDDYDWTGSETCVGSPHLSWIRNGQEWWTKSASSLNANSVWAVNDGVLDVYSYTLSLGVRPVITISEATYDLMENAADDVCVSAGYLYGEDTGTDYRCYFEYYDQLLHCTYTYNGTATGGCSAPI